MSSKGDKITEAKGLLSKSDKQVLTDAEIKFLKARPGVNYENFITYKHALIIRAKDNKATAKMIQGIAMKLNCTVIRFVRHVVGKVSVKGLRGVVTVPKQITEGGTKSEPPKMPEIIINKVPEPDAIDFIPDEVEAKEKVYTLSFPSVWDDMEND